MIPTETEGPAKLAWHKSTRIKKKELQSDFTQDFGLDPRRSLSSDERPSHRSWQFPPVRGCSAGGEHPKDNHLRPPRLRRTTAARHAASSGQHSLPGVELAGTPTLPMSTRLTGAWLYPPVSDGFGGVQTFLRDLSSGEDGIVGGGWLGSTVSSGGQPTAGGE